MKKAQASLDFLMTYGWALLLIVLVVGALFALGIFDVSSFTGSRASGFPQVGVTAWKLDPSGVLTTQFRNQVGSQINVTSINATIGTTTVTYSTPFTITSGKTSGTTTVGTFSNVGAVNSAYTVSLAITYSDLSTGFSYTDTGTLTGKVTN